MFHLVVTEKEELAQKKKIANDVYVKRILLTHKLPSTKAGNNVRSKINELDYTPNIK